MIDLKKLFNSKIFCFLLGGIIFCSITVLATSVLAKEIVFVPDDTTWEVNNVEDAINSLYSNNDNIRLVSAFVSRFKDFSAVAASVSLVDNDYVNVDDNIVTIKETGNYKLFYYVFRGYNVYKYTYEYVINEVGTNVVTDTSYYNTDTVELNLKEGDTLYLRGKFLEDSSAVSSAFAILYKD